MAKLTARMVETIQPDETRREIPDSLLRGLYLILQPSGVKSWAVRYRHHGRPRKHTLGSYPAIDLKTARELGTKALRTAAEGRDPGIEKRVEKQAAEIRNIDSVDGLFIEFLTKHIKTKKGTAIRESTRRQTAGLLGYKRDPDNPNIWIKTGKGVVAHWRGRSIHDIMRRDVIDVLDKIKQVGPVTVNRTLSALKTCFAWRVRQDSETLPRSPCDDIDTPSPETKRDRVLSENELRLVWNAADQIGAPFGSIVKLLILTGQRRGEVANMEWQEIDFQNSLWRLPRERVKNGIRHEVPLSSQAAAIIEEAPRISDRRVFSRAANNFVRSKRSLDALLPQPIPHWTLHDLRRSVASGLARLGVNLLVIEKVLNHVSGTFGGIVGVYQHHDFADEKRAALDAWASFVKSVVSGKQPANVVALRAGQ